MGPRSLVVVNARAETVAKKPTFRGPFKRTRCLMPRARWGHYGRRGRAAARLGIGARTVSAAVTARGLSALCRRGIVLRTKGTSARGGKYDFGLNQRFDYLRSRRDLLLGHRTVCQGPSFGQSAETAGDTCLCGGDPSAGVSALGELLVPESQVRETWFEAFLLDFGFCPDEGTRGFVVGCG